MATSKKAKKAKAPAAPETFYAAFGVTDEGYPMMTPFCTSAKEAISEFEWCEGYGDPQGIITAKKQNPSRGELAARLPTTQVADEFGWAYLEG
jgi:hypothetical protein